MQDKERSNSQLQKIWINCGCWWNSIWKSFENRSIKSLEIDLWRLVSSIIHSVSLTSVRTHVALFPFSRKETDVLRFLITVKLLNSTYCILGLKWSVKLLISQLAQHFESFINGIKWNIFIHLISTLNWCLDKIRRLKTSAQALVSCDARFQTFLLDY